MTNLHFFPVHTYKKSLRKQLQTDFKMDMNDKVEINYMS